MHRAATPHPRIAPLLALASTLLAAPAMAAWPTSPTVQVPLSQASADQVNPVGCSDGAGGAIYVWVDTRSGNQDLYAQRVSATGVPLWTTDGVVVCDAPGDQGRIGQVPQVGVIADGNGGAFVCWEDRRALAVGTSDVYAQHLSANGTTLWTANGVPVTTAAGNQLEPWPVADGAGGCFITWYDTNGYGALVAEHLDASGTLLWPVPGATLFAGVSGNLIWDDCPGVADGAGGFFVPYYRSPYGGVELDVARVNGSGVVQWNDMVVSESSSATVVLGSDDADGLGGVLVSYYDYPGGLAAGNQGLFRATALGQLVYDVRPIGASGTANIESNSWLVPDGYGGAYVAWQDNRNGGWDVYAQYVNGAGYLMWNTAGLAVCTAASDQTWPRGSTDGAGGAIFAWEDRRNAGASDIYAQGFSPNGANLLSGGVPVAQAPGDQYQPWPIFDGRSGAVMAWTDSRYGNYDVYSQRLDRTGYVGDPAPVIAGVQDVPNDQGGYVKLSWQASYLDLYPSYTVGSYEVWRSIPASLAQLALAHGARLLSDGDDPASLAGRVLMASSLAGGTIYWEYLGAQLATGDPGYSYEASTSSDSMPASNPLTLFRVVARARSGTNQWASLPDSGYSVDNLAPNTPAPFVASYSGGTTLLHWGANSEADLYGYRLYRGASAGFTPGPSNLVVATPDTAYADPVGSAGWYYKLSAVDVHGNESGFALVTPSGTTGVGEAPAALSFAAPSPNPARGAVMLRFTLPAASAVRVVVTDVAGRVVARPVDARMEAGTHEVAWSARDAAGRELSGGLYFAVLTTGGERRVERFAILR